MATPRDLGGPCGARDQIRAQSCVLSTVVSPGPREIIYRASVMIPVDRICTCSGSGSRFGIIQFKLCGLRTV